MGARTCAPAWVLAFALVGVLGPRAARADAHTLHHVLLDTDGVEHAPPASELAAALRAQLGAGVRVERVSGRPDRASVDHRRRWATALVLAHRADALVWLEPNGSDALSLFVLDGRDDPPRLGSIRVVLGDAFDVQRTCAIGARGLLTGPDAADDAARDTDAPSAPTPRLRWRLSAGATMRIPDAAFGARATGGLRLGSHVGVDLEVGILAPETIDAARRLRIPVGIVTTARVAVGPVGLGAGLIGRLAFAHLSGAAGADGFAVAATLGLRVQAEVRLFGPLVLSVPVDADARMVEVEGQGFRPGDVAPPFELATGLMLAWSPP